MNLHMLASAPVGAVNPRVPVMIYSSAGASEPGPDGRRTPTYSTPVTRMAQLQRITTEDLRLLVDAGLQLQGERMRIYVWGDVEGILRPDGLGGDLVQLTDGSTWKTTLVVDRFMDPGGQGWTSAILTRQMAPAPLPAPISTDAAPNVPTPPKPVLR